MNVNGKNMLACITPLSSLQGKLEIRPLSGMPVVRDLVVDMDNFFNNYKDATPWLQADSQAMPSKEFLQSQSDRAKLDGLYECILCGCCSSACPSYWWNPDKFLGPAAALQAARFIHDSRDGATVKRLSSLGDAYKIFRCRSIYNCADVCPKGLNPGKAISTIRHKLIDGEC
jgi:succinate dehydrogenase / fumarate reductase iron-sulfur subunit